MKSIQTLKSERNKYHSNFAHNSTVIKGKQSYGKLPEKVFLGIQNEWPQKKIALKKAVVKPSLLLGLLKIYT